MTQLQLSRRSLITGLGALFVAAPAIVRASSIMPVKAWVETWPSPVISHDGFLSFLYDGKMWHQSGNLLGGGKLYEVTRPGETLVLPRGVAGQAINVINLGNQEVTIWK